MTEKLTDLDLSNDLADDDLVYAVDISETTGNFSGPDGKSVRITKADFLKIGTDIQAYSSVLDNTTASFTVADETKLDGIEDAATADQTGAEIKTLYEAEADTNAFTDAEKAKLDGIEDAATADQTGAEIKTLYEAEADTNAFTDAEKAKLDGIEDAATADQTGAEIKALYEAELDTNAFTDAEKSKLAAIEAGARADQTGAEIKTLYEAELDTNAFTDAEKNKLNLSVVSDTTGIVNASQILNIVSISQADYDNIAVPDSNTIYYIV